MPTVDPFLTNEFFNMASLTASVSQMPNRYGRVGELALFRDRPVTTRSVIVEEMSGILNLVVSKAPGSPGSVNKPARRKAHSFQVLHIPLDGELLAEEYQGVRAWGTDSEVDTQARILNDRLAQMRSKFEITWEHLRMGALKGTIVDADGATLFNLYTVFGITPKVVDYDLGNAGTSVAAKNREVVRHIEDNLRGEVMTAVRALVSGEFFDKLIAHESVKEAYRNWAAAQQFLAGDVRSGFSFAGVTFEEYRGVATDGEGNSRRFIAADEGHAFPVGTMDTFINVVSPADFLDTANTPGVPLYARQEPKKFNRGIDIHMQSNVLPLATRPAVLVKVHTTT